MANRICPNSHTQYAVVCVVWTSVYSPSHATSPHSRIYYPISSSGTSKNCHHPHRTMVVINLYFPRIRWIGIHIPDNPSYLYILFIYLICHCKKHTVTARNEMTRQHPCHCEEPKRRGNLTTQNHATHN